MLSSQLEPMATDPATSTSAAAATAYRATSSRRPRPPIGTDAQGRRLRRADIDDAQRVDGAGRTKATLATGGVKGQVARKILGRVALPGREPLGEQLVELGVACHASARAAMARMRTAVGPLTAASSSSAAATIAA